VEDKNIKLEASIAMMMLLIFVFSNKIGYLEKDIRQIIQNLSILLLMI
jgi:hypothetical protein